MEITGKLSRNVNNFKVLYCNLRFVEGRCAASWSALLLLLLLIFSEAGQFMSCVPSHYVQAAVYSSELAPTPVA